MNYEEVQELVGREVVKEDAELESTVKMVASRLRSSLGFMGMPPNPGKIADFIRNEILPDLPLHNWNVKVRADGPDIHISYNLPLPMYKITFNIHEDDTIDRCVI